MFKLLNNNIEIYFKVNRLSKFLLQSVDFANHNGGLVTLMLLFAVSVLFFAMGLALKGTEDSRTIADTRIQAHIETAEAKLELELEKKIFEYTKALQILESFRNDTNAIIETITGEFREEIQALKLSLYDEYNAKIVELNEELNQKKETIREAKIRLIEKQREIELGSEKWRSKVIEDYYAVREAHVKSHSDLNYFNKEIFTFLKKINSEIFEKGNDPGLNETQNVEFAKSLFLLKVKLSAFIDEYELKIDRYSQKAPLIAPLPTFTPEQVKSNQSLNEIDEIVELEPIVVTGSNISMRPEDIKLDETVFEFLDADLPKLTELASINGITTAIRNGTLWQYPIMLGCLTFTYAIAFGYFLVSGRIEPSTDSELT